MIDLDKAYARAKKQVESKIEFLGEGIYFYIELKEVYAFLCGLNEEYCRTVITVNKDGGKINVYKTREFLGHFNDFDYDNLNKIDNPDTLEIVIDNPIENIDSILDFNFDNKISKRDHIYSLVETGESCRTVEKIISCGITLDNIGKMDLYGFAKAYGQKRKEIYKKVYDLSRQELINNDISIYALYGRGLSEKYCNDLHSFGIDKIYKLCMIPREIFSTKYSVSDSFVEKVYEALDKTNFKLVHDNNTKKWGELFWLDDNYRKVVKSEIHKLISKSEQSIKPLALKNNIDIRFLYLDNLNEIINEMIQDKIISLNEFGLKANIIRLEDYLNYLPENSCTKLAKEYFLDDESTYESLAQPRGITRERVRQLLKKVPIPEVYEDCYGEYFKKYDFSVKTFTQLFDEKKYVYKYLMYKYDKKGSSKLEDLLNDEFIDSKMRYKLEEIFGNKYLFINGENIYKSKATLLKYYMKKNVRELTHIDDIWKGFKEFLNEYYPNYSEEKFDEIDDVRDIEAPITDEHFPSVKTNRRKYKYYDINSSENIAILANLELNQYKDIQISTKYLYELHFDLMREYNIDDPYVLHNLLKKICSYDGVDFKRSPYIVFGNGNINKQLDELILDNAPISISKLSELYCEIYGGNVNTVGAHIFKQYREIINKQIISLEYGSPLSELEINKSRDLLFYEDVWFKEDIERIFKQNNIDIPLNFYAWQNLEKIGFKNASNYIYSTKYDSMKECLEKKYFSGDFIDTAIIDKRIRSLVLFSGMITEKRKNLEIIEYEKGKFMKSSLLEIANIDINDLTDFIRDVDEFTINKGPFTIKSIRNEGFYHKIFDLGFENIFYASILRGNDKFAFKRYIGETLFKNMKERTEISISDLLEKILFTYRHIEEYDLAKFIEEVYGIDYRGDYYSLQSYAKNTNIYYDKYTNTYYYDYDTYYEEM